MADSDPAPSPPETTPPSPSPKKDDLRPVAAKIEELNESQSELLSRLQGLKQDLQGWRSKMDTQVKTYKDDLSVLKKQLETDLEHLRMDFQELRTTLQKQQEDVTTSLKNLGLQDAPETSASGESEIKDKEDDSEKAQAPLSGSTEEINPAAESST